MTLALSTSPIADIVADLLRRIADAISPPRTATAVTARSAPPPVSSADEHRAMLSHAFRTLPPHLRRDLGVDA